MSLNFPGEMNVLEGGDIFAEDFINQERSIADAEIPSDIQNFFDDATVFVTGATGFMGQVLLEKLLRTCWRLRRVYVFVRSKKGKSPSERFSGIFDGPLFEHLRNKRAGFVDQVVLVNGDLSLPGLGLDDEDRQKLVQEVNIVFHCAATVRFDETMRTAVNINMRGTESMLKLGKEMKKLKSFIHISTAYSNCPRKFLEEKFYKPPLSYADLMKLTDILTDGHFEALTPSLLDKWPNTYTYTKAISESMVKELGKGMPLGVIRPSIVTSTAYEPVCGWINNYFGPQGVTVGAAVGLLRTLHCDPNVLADMVPVDLAINATIALAWDVGQTKGDNPNFEKIAAREAEESPADATQARNPPSDDDDDDDDGSSDIPVLNFVSSEKRPITWGTFMKMNMQHGLKLGTMHSIWYCSLTLNRNYYIDRVYQCAFHFFPALVVDLVARIVGRKPILWNAHKKISKFSKVISYFCTAQWKFHDDNVWQLWSKLSDRDKRLFNFNLEALDWETYMFTYIRGLRVYLNKDDLSTVPVALKRHARLKVLHYTVATLMTSLLLYCLWKLLCFVFLR